MSIQDEDPHRSFGLGSPSPANDQSLQPMRQQLVETIELMDIFEETAPTETEQRKLLSQMVIKIDRVREAILEIESKCLKVADTDARVFSMPVEEPHA
jgi:hypothetical protein